MISVCMATYNGQKYIKQQISSILAQLHPDDELIISDDGSSDQTIEIIQSFEDPRVVLIHSNTKNLIKNFENALRLARGEYIFLADQDDIWLKGKVSSSLQFLERGYDLVVTDCKIVNEDLTEIYPSFFKLRDARVGFMRNFIRNTQMGCCMGFSRKVLQRSLPFPDDIPMHDLWIGMVASLVGKVKHINEPYVLYRRHGLNASETGMISTAPFSQKLKWRTQLALAVVKNIFRFFGFKRR